MQSSCTRSEVEAESKHTNSFLEFKQITGRHLSSDPKSSKKNGETNTQTIRDNNLVPRKEGDSSPKRCKRSNDNNTEKASRDIEVVHIIDDEQKHDTQEEVDDVGTASQGNADKWFSIPAHQLELSLRRSDYSPLEDQEKNDKRTLNHSTSSAFSLYNCKPASSVGNIGDAQPCSTSASHADTGSKNGFYAAPSQDKAARPPIRAVPFPAPAGGLTFDGQPFWSRAPMAPLLYPQSGPPIWNSEAAMSQQASTQATSSQQKWQQNNDPTEMESQQTENMQEQEALPAPNANEKRLHVEIPLDHNPQQVSPMTGESGSSTVLNNSGGSACGSSSNPITNPTEPCNASNGVPENPGMEGSHHLSQREVALNKFRLKRKERCFEKKVRYQSRKLLAEQRPRVKGQFVRQDQSVQGS
jgi:pseudo-response regulator 5